MKTVLVTGCAGYVGSTLCPLLLERGWYVIGVDSLLYDNWRGVSHVCGHDNFEFQHTDVRIFPEMKRLVHRADAVVSLAALVGPVCDKKPREAVEVNLEAVRMMLEETSPAQRWLQITSNSGYGRAAVATEDSPLNPLSLYARTKVEAERLALEKVNSVSLRFATLFGVSARMRWDLLVNDFVYRLRSYEKLDLYQPGYRRSVTHVRDACRAVLHAFEIQPGIYNVAATNVTKKDLAGECCELLGLSAGCVTEAAGEDPDQRDYAVSSEKLVATGFEFTRSLARGIAELDRAVAFSNHRWEGNGEKPCL